MGKILEQIKRYIMYISLQERREREYLNYCKKVDRLKTLPELKLSSEYVYIKARYAYCRNLLSVFVIAILLVVLMETWKDFFKFLESVFQYMLQNQSNSLEVAEIGVLILVTIVACVTFVVILSLVAHLKAVHSLYKELLIIEEVRNERENRMKNKNKDTFFIYIYFGDG